MSQADISKNKHINAALHLDGDPAKVQAFYEDWAETYKTDTSSIEYQGPQIAADLLAEVRGSNAEKNRHCAVLDAGCGSGFVGEALRKQGYESIDGFDLSIEMAKLASATGCYRRVKDNVDMMKADHIYSAESYDVVTSIGVFTLGHVPPEALTILLKLVTKGGLMIISTRTHYYDQTHFQTLVDDLVDSNRLKLIKLIKDAPYNIDGDAHYWLFQK